MSDENFHLGFTSKIVRSWTGLEIDFFYKIVIISTVTMANKKIVWPIDETKQNLFIESDNKPVTWSDFDVNDKYENGFYFRPIVSFKSIKFKRELSPYTKKVITKVEVKPSLIQARVNPIEDIEKSPTM
jgi:hypothetical protein